jgi:hypothetical protein
VSSVFDLVLLSNSVIIGHDILARSAFFPFAEHHSPSVLHAVIHDIPDHSAFFPFAEHYLLSVLLAVVEVPLALVPACE